MDGRSIQFLIAMSAYMIVVVGIGVYFAQRANKNTDNYFLGGRSLGPWVAALSAAASDMSGWLLMGLPGVAYWMGLADATWTAIGLALGTYLNWLLIAKRLRHYSTVSDSITIPDFLSARFREKKKIIMTISSVFILVFFTVYMASCFVTCGKLFSTLFGTSYISMTILGALFVILYTFLGGFLAESASDTMQAFIMVVALVGVLGGGLIAAGGWNAMLENINNIPGFLSFFKQAQPVVVDGTQQMSGNTAQFGAATNYGFLTIISTLSWGLGYFGMPQVLLRFMAIRDAEDLTRSRRIGAIWVVISLSSAVLIGIIGRSLYPTELLSTSTAENVFIIMATRLMPPLVAGLAMAGIVAAAISSADSYLLIAASAVAKNIYQGILKKDATDKDVMRVTRITLLVIAVVGLFIAMDEQSVIFQIVSFAWAGFGATFGPLIIFSLFWKRTSYAGALAGMISGGLMVFVWKLLIRPIGGVFGIYELLPAFLVSSLVIFVVSLATEPPSQEVLADFEAARSLQG
jgi:sodium/proline symporter